MKIALFADYHGGNRVWPLLEDALEDQRLDLIVFAGDILDSAEREAEWQKVRSTGKAPRKPKAESEQDGVIDELVYREFFINLTGFGVPIVFVPGHLDAPTARLNETVKGFTNAHNVQEKSFEMAGYTFIGWGGAVGPVDTDYEFYCSKERAFKKRLSSGFDRDPARTILLVHTPPISMVDLDPAVNDHVGAKVINEVIEKHQPAFCFCGHAHGTPGQDSIGPTVVVNPGPMFRGRYALINTEQHRVLFPTPLKV